MSIIGIKKILSLSLLTFSAVSTLLLEPALAQTLYVDDQLIISLREGPGTDSKAIRAIKTGTPLVVLEEQDHSVKVRMQDGKEGWVQKQYLSSAIPKADVIARMEKEIERLKRRGEDLEKNLTSQQNELKTTRSDHAEKVKKLEEDTRKSSEEFSRTAQELKRVTDQYNNLVAASKRTVELVDEDKKLKNENKELSSEVKSLREENTTLKRTGMIYWFLAGGGVLFAGFLVGRITKKKRYYY
jgi:SH3 domain protein